MRSEILDVHSATVFIDRVVQSQATPALADSILPDVGMPALKPFQAGEPAGWRDLDVFEEASDPCLMTGR
jgi:hypothetical protein